MKQTIKLTESTLRNMIEEAVTKVVENLMTEEYSDNDFISAAAYIFAIIKEGENAF